MHGMFGIRPLDEAAAHKSSHTMAEAQKGMFELQLDARKKLDAVLSKGQHWNLSRYRKAADIAADDPHPSALDNLPQWRTVCT
jgi:hypothetical protein